MDTEHMGAFSTLMTTTNTVVHMMIAIILFMAWNIGVNLNIIGLSRLVLLQLHIIFSTTGFLFFMVESILSLNPFNAWSRHLSRDQKKNVHLGMQVMGTLWIVIGFSCIVSFRINHFDTAHAIFGLISFILTMLGSLNGLVTYFGKKLSSNIQLTPVKFLHTLIGCLAVTMGLITLCIGMNRTIIVNSYGITTIVFVVFILLYILINPILNLKNLFDKMKTTPL